MRGTELLRISIEQIVAELNISILNSKDMDHSQEQAAQKLKKGAGLHEYIAECRLYGRKKLDVVCKGK